VHADPYKSKVFLAFGNIRLAYAQHILKVVFINLDFDKIDSNFGRKYPFDNDHALLHQGLTLV
jgi:hypothetical protein